MSGRFKEHLKYCSIFEKSLIAAFVEIIVFCTAI
jgi:hypothetical protein